MDPTGQFARRFPLVARPRPACIPLAGRVADLCSRARVAERDGDLAAASAVHKLRGYQGIGRRMLDGRQVAVIAHAASGDTDGALALLGAN